MFLLCFQGDRGPKGNCGGDGPKGDKVRKRPEQKLYKEEDEEVAATGETLHSDYCTQTAR